MPVSQFIDHWLGLSAKNHGNDLVCSDDSQTLLYLKDWHFVKEYPEYVAYTTPHFFADDWLNLYLDSYSMHQVAYRNHIANEINCSDYRFVYMGAKGTWTPLHADVFRSYSWSANICGRKIWFFLPPSQCHLIFDRNLKNSVYDVHSNVSETTFPGFKQAVWLECTQERNEIIFVPSGWYHQVHNLEDTISINHNWFNGYNLSWVWNLLVKDYKEAKEYIEDIRDICDDFESLCQRNLAANTGMNYYDFFVFITRFTLANLTILQSLKCKENSSKAHNIIANIISIRQVASKMVSAEAFSEENIKRCYETKEQTKEEESNFLKFCTAISMSYEAIEEEQKPYCKERKSSAKLRNVKLGMDILQKYASSSPLELCTAIDKAVSEHRLSCKDCKLCMHIDNCNDETLGFERVVL